MLLGLVVGIGLLGVLVVGLLLFKRLGRHVGPAPSTRAATGSTAARPELADDELLGDPPHVIDPSGRPVPVRDWFLHYTGRPNVSWASLVAEFYRRVAEDPDIRAYFTQADHADLPRHFTAAIIMVCQNGVTTQTLRLMEEKHRHVRAAETGLAITGEVYDRTIDILVTLLVEYGMPDDVINQLTRTVRPLREVIVQEAGQVWIEGA